MFKKLQIQWLSLMAHVHIQQRQFQPAIVLLEASMELKPKHFEVVKALAFSYLKGQRPSCCLRLIDGLLKSPISKTDKYFLTQMKGQALWQLDERDKANAAFTQSKHFSMPKSSEKTLTGDIV